MRAPAQKSIEIAPEVAKSSAETQCRRHTNSDSAVANHMSKQSDVNMGLSREEHKDLKTLTSDTEFIVRQADKGGSIVLQDRATYMAEALFPAATYLLFPTKRSYKD